MASAETHAGDSRLSRWLFAPADPACIRLFRVLLSLVLLWNFWPRELGLHPMYRHIPGLVDLYEAVFLTWWPYWGIVAGVIVSFASGWRPTLTGLCLAALLLPLIYLERFRQSRQVLLFVVLACAMLGERGPMWPVRLIQIQLALIYGVNAIAKTNPDYLSGHALIRMSEELHNFLVTMSDGYLRVGPITMPVQWAAVLSTVTEYGLAAGFWFRRTRLATAAAGIGFHLMLQRIVRIGMLDWTSMFLYLAFLLPFQPRPNREASG
jgi:hypothetical protein